MAAVVVVDSNMVVEVVLAKDAIEVDNMDKNAVFYFVSPILAMGDPDNN